MAQKKPKKEVPVPVEDSKPAAAVANAPKPPLQSYFLTIFRVKKIDPLTKKEVMSQYRSSLSSKDDFDTNVAKVAKNEVEKKVSYRIDCKDGSLNVA